MDFPCWMLVFFVSCSWGVCGVLCAGATSSLFTLPRILLFAQEHQRRRTTSRAPWVCQATPPPYARVLPAASCGGTTKWGKRLPLHLDGVHHGPEAVIGSDLVFEQLELGRASSVFAVDAINGEECPQAGPEQVILPLELGAKLVFLHLLIDGLEGLVHQSLERVDEPVQCAEHGALHHGVSAEFDEDLVAENLDILLVCEANDQGAHECHDVELFGEVVQDRVDAAQCGLAQWEPVVDLLLERAEVHHALNLEQNGFKENRDDEGSEEGLDEGRLVVDGGVAHLQGSQADAQVLVPEHGKKDLHVCRQGRSWCISGHAVPERGDHSPAHQGLCGVLAERAQLAENGLWVHGQQSTKALGHHVPHALLWGLTVLDERRHHQVEVWGEVQLRARRVQRDGLLEGGEQKVVVLLLGERREYHREEGPHVADSCPAQGKGRCSLHFLARAIKGSQDDVLEVGDGGEVPGLAQLPNSQERQVLLRVFTPGERRQ
mmetsp:Transcript_15339/g.45431  ORF Transcript_15339/g.45431 Transcript_15339/m.45431 type:complete len:490 (+) Transcript_15339:129-1598(+)